MSQSDVIVSTDIEEKIDKGLDSPWNCVLYNDEYHTFEEVIFQIIKAIACSFNKAKQLTMEVHFKGKAVVFSGEIEKCLSVSSVLEEIQLHTEIQSLS